MATPPLAISAGPQAAMLKPLDFSDLDGFVDDDLADLWPALAAGAAALVEDRAPLRPAAAAPAALVRVFADLLAGQPPAGEALRDFLTRHFRPYEILTQEGTAAKAFLTGYYEPEIEGSLSRSTSFAAPILARPADFPRLSASPDPPADWPYPDRAAIENGALPGALPLLYVRDAIEAFMIHLQGSARIRLGDGTVLRLTYDGRNGHTYSSIGRKLVERGAVPLAELDLARLKQWVRDAGQEPGQAGRALLHENRSFIFFRIDRELSAALGPRGGAGVPLVPLRSIAIDRSIWSYGLPFWFEAELPWRGRAPTRFRCLMVAGDTGSAIVGPSRADLFFGSGEAAGNRAGDIRHRGRMVVLLPRDKA